jgi:hypothetical protein
MPETAIGAYRGPRNPAPRPPTPPGPPGEDLVAVGDDAQVGGWTSLQTHLFEDRVMKMSALVVGPHASVGPRSVVLYDAALGAGCALDALSLAMKGEVLPGESRWRGIPARRMD